MNSSIGSSQKQYNKSLLSTDQLEYLLGSNDQNLTILSASAKIGKQSDKNMTEEERYREHIREGRIPGATYFDVNLFDIKDQQRFNCYMKNIGVRKDDHIVIYDNQGLLAASRAFWLLTAMGCPNLYMLNGTLGKWIHEQRETNYFPSMDLWRKNRSNLDYDALDNEFSIDKNYLAHLDRVKRIMKMNESFQPKDRIPLIDGGCLADYKQRDQIIQKNVPYQDILETHQDLYTTFKDKESITDLFREKGGMMEPEYQEAILLSNKGYSASVLFSALHILGNRKAEVFDGKLHDLIQAIQKLDQ